MQVGMHEAKTRLSELVGKLQAGEEILITNRGKVVAQLALPREERCKRAAAAVKRLRKLKREHPLGSFEEAMAWRREGLA